MKITVKDRSDRDNTELVEMIKGFVPFTQERLGYEQPFSINLVSDSQNASDPFGKTAFYSPEDFSITLFVDNRHNKDILRSLSHEIVHHYQNCAGKFPENSTTEEGYAQKDLDLRNLEAEAYLLGNGLMFRDYEDSLKENKTMKKQLDKETLRYVLAEAIKRVYDKDETSEPAEESVEQVVTESVKSDDTIVRQDTAINRLKKERSEYRFRVLMENLRK